MKRIHWQVIIGLLVVAGIPFSVSGAPITKAQLLAMAAGHVETPLMLELVERDCVDFDVDAANVVELSKTISSSVIEAAIRCRGAAPAVVVAQTAAQAPASLPAASPTAPAPGEAQLRARADFIGESGELTCKFQLDGKPFATLTKPPQGDFGQAVERTKIRKDGGFVPVPAGRHAIVAACDPGGKEMKVELDLAIGSKTSVDVAETMFRGWKVGGVFAAP